MTLLEVINIFRECVDNNIFIKSFNVHELYTINQSANIIYPSLFLEVPRVNSVNKTTQQYSINFVVQDRVLEDRSNEIAILGKTKQIGESVLNYIYNNYKDNYKSLEYNIVPYMDSLTDRTCGWRFEIELTVQDNVLCKDVTTSVPFLQVPVSLYVNSNVIVNTSSSTYTFNITQPPAGLIIEWSLDNFVTVAGTGTTYTINLQNPGTQIIYVRTTNGVDVSPVTTHTLTVNQLIPNVLPVSANNLQLDWKLGTQNFTLSINETIATGLTVEWSDDNFVTVLAQGETLQDTIDTSLVNSKLYYVRTNNSVTTSSVSTVTVSRKAFSLQKAWFFDRVNDQITMLYDPTHPVYDFGTGDFTVSLWYKVTTTGVSHSIFNTYSVSNTGIFFLHNPNGSGAWALRNDGPGQGGVQQFNVSAGLLPFNQIINLILVRNGLNRTNWRIFVNGVNTNTATGIITTQVNLVNQGNINLGIIPGANRLGGQMAHFQMFNRALTDLECQQIYNSGAGNYPPVSTITNLVVYHTLQKRLGSIVQPITPSEISETMSYGIGINYTADPIVNF
jgi:hypothetical protein